MSDYRIVYECSLCKRTFRIDEEATSGWDMSTLLKQAWPTVHKCTTFSIGTAKPIGIEFGPEL